MSVPKPSPDLWPRTPKLSDKPKRKRVRRHLTQKLRELENIEAVRAAAAKKEN